MTDAKRIVCRIGIIAAAGLAVAGCENVNNHAVAAHAGRYDLRDRDTKQTAITTNLEPGDRASITYLGYQPIQATWDRHFIAGTDQSAGWQWMALDPDGRYGFDKAK